MKKVVLLALILISNLCFAKSLFNDDSSKRNIITYSNEQKKQIGDIITVIVSENSQAAQNVQTQSNGATNAKISQGTGLFDFISGNLASDTKNSVDYKGSGSNQRSGNIRAVVSARINEVLPNGDYRIQGMRNIKINHEEQRIEVKGIIRPQDVSEGNTITSEKIAEAEITYGGKGALSITSKPGLFTRVLHWIF